MAASTRTSSNKTTTTRATLTSAADLRQQYQRKALRADARRWASVPDPSPTKHSERERLPTPGRQDLDGSSLLPPDEQYLLGLRAELEQFYEVQDEQIRRLRRVRQMEEPVALPKRYRLVDVEVRSPVVADECQRVAATLGINWAKLAVTPRSESDTDQENATQRETWTEEVLRIAGSRIDGVDTLVAAIDAAVSDGGAWTKLIFSRDLWEQRYRLRLGQFKDDTEEVDVDEYETDDAGEVRQDDAGQPVISGKHTETRTTKSRVQKHQEAIQAAKRAAGPPFTWVCCDTLQVYPVWTGGKLAEVLEIQERPISSVFRQYRLNYNRAGELAQDLLPEETWEGQAVSARGGDGTPSHQDRSVVFLEHWDSTWCSLYVVGKHLADPSKKTGRVVQQWKHGYGQVPYFYAPGVVMSHWRNRKTGWGVAELLRWLVEYQSFLLTLHAQVAARDSLPPFQQVASDSATPLEGDEAEESQDDNLVPDVWELRQILKNAPGRELKPLQMPDQAATLEKQIALVETIIEKLRSVRPSSTISGAMEGAGFAISQVLAEARIRHDPIAQNVERMLEKVTRFLWKLVRDKLGEPVWVYTDSPKAGGKWRSAGPEDLGDDVRIRWRLDPERASAKLIEARYWHERVKAGSASMDQAITAMGDNPDEVREGIAMDFVRQSDFYKGRLMKRLAQKVGAGDAIQQAISDLLIQRQDQALQAQPAGQAGVQGGIQGPPQAMGGPSGIVPDMGALALAPGGAGAAGQPMPGGGLGPPNGAVMGAGAGAVVPQQSAAPMAQLTA